MEWEYLHHVSRLPFVWLPVSENAVIKASFTNEALPRLTLRVFVRYCRCVLKTPSSEGEQIYDTKKRERILLGRPVVPDVKIMSALSSGRSMGSCFKTFLGSPL